MLVFIFSSSIKGTGLVSHELEQVRKASKEGRALVYKSVSVQLFLLRSGGFLHSLPAEPPLVPSCSVAAVTASTQVSHWCSEIWTPFLLLGFCPGSWILRVSLLYYFLRIKMLLSLTLPLKVSQHVKTPPIYSGCKGAAFHLKSQDWWLGAGSLVSFLPSSSSSSDSPVCKIPCVGNQYVDFYPPVFMFYFFSFK